MDHNILRHIGAPILEECPASRETFPVGGPLAAASEALNSAERSRAFELLEVHHGWFFVSQTKSACCMLIAATYKNAKYLTKADCMRERVRIFIRSHGIPQALAVPGRRLLRASLSTSGAAVPRR